MIGKIAKEIRETRKAKRIAAKIGNLTEFKALTEKEQILQEKLDKLLDE